MGLWGSDSEDLVWCARKNAAFKMFEVFRMKEDVTPLIESDKEKFKKPYTAP